MVDIPLWKIRVKVSWDDEIPTEWKNKTHVPIHQPVCLLQKASYCGWLRNPNHQLKTVVNIPLFIGFENHPFGGAGFLSFHPAYVTGKSTSSMSFPWKPGLKASYFGGIVTCHVWLPKGRYTFLANPVAGCVGWTVSAQTPMFDGCYPPVY